LRRIGLADQEAKISLLRDRAKVKRPAAETEVSSTSTNEPPLASTAPAEHVNFFNDLEAGKYVSTKVNADHVKEKKEEQEKYEKQVGYLTYLGQDTNEATGKRDWYDVAPNRAEKFDESGKKIEVNLKSKMLYDPMKVIERYVGRSIKSLPSIPKTEDTKTVKKYEPIIDSTFKEHRKRKRSLSPSNSERSSKKKRKSKKKKHKKEKKKSKHRSQSPSSSSLSSDDEEKRILQKQKLEKLRAERLLREKVERAKADKLLAKLRGDPDPEEIKKAEETKKAEQQPRPVKQKYNSQFNPAIARQNYD
jgi:hypothetical protein